MTPIDLTNLESRIDRDKRDREREILLLLLLLLLRTRRHADAAIRVGADPYGAMAAVMLGSRVLNQRGGTERLAALLIASDLAGFRRTQLVIPGEAVTYRPGIDYRSTAAIALSQMLGTLRWRVALAFASAQQGVTGARTALRAAFRTGGYVEDNPYTLDTAAVGLVGQAYGAGQWNGYRRPDVREVVRGFQYSAVLDDRTTEICNTYHGVRLPTDHPWWLSHWPLNHFRCRSIVRPIVEPFTPTEDIPYTPPPMAGFGRAPFALYATFGTAA